MNTKNTIDQSTKMMLRKHLNLDYDSEPTPVSKSDRSGVTISKIVWSKPVGKVLIIGGGAVVLLFAMGGLFRLLAWVLIGYNQFKKAGPDSHA